MKKFEREEEGYEPKQRKGITQKNGGIGHGIGNQRPAEHSQCRRGACL